MNINLKTRWDRTSAHRDALLYVTRNSFKRSGESGFMGSTRQVSVVRPQKVGLPNAVYTNTKWGSKARLMTEARKYTTRTRFNSASPGAYMAAKRFGILDEICAHMEVAAKKVEYEDTYLYEYIHPEGFVYIGITVTPRLRHKTHMKNEAKEYTCFIANDVEPELYSRYCPDQGRFIPKKMTRSKAERLERYLIRARARQGWKVVNTHHNPQHVYKAYTWQKPEYVDKLAIPS